MSNVTWECLQLVLMVYIAYMQNKAHTHITYQQSHVAQNVQSVIVQVLGCVGARGIAPTDHTMYNTHGSCGISWGVPSILVLHHGISLEMSSGRREM